MHSLPSEIHTSLKSQTAFPNLQCRKNGNLLPGGGEVEAPQTAFEKVMYPNSTASRQALLWLEREAKQRGIHIHHAMCGHGGERWLPREGGKMKSSPVDGYNHETRTVF